MGMGYCRGGRTTGRNNPVVIQPLKVRWLRDDNEKDKRLKKIKQSGTKVQATKGNKPWTQTELEKLYSLDHIPAQEVARILKRSFWAINHKRRARYKNQWSLKS